MDWFWKLLTVLIFIEMIIVMYYYTSKSNISFTLPTGEILPVKERNIDSFDTKTNNYIAKHKSNNSKGSLLLAYLKRGRPTLAFDTVDLPNKMVTHNMTDPEKQTKYNSKSTIPTFSKLEEKEVTNGNQSYNSSNVTTEIKTACIISFDHESLQKARKKLLASIAKSYYLFHVHLDTNGLNLTDSSENKDDLLHWQYILKKEKFLVQLPVDFDLLTYNLLVYDKEEAVLKIQLVYNDSNCIQSNFSKNLQTIRYLLWNNLFVNDTDHYLCNRNFQEEKGRDALYYITTIWVGYDLNCSDGSSKNTNYSDIFQLEKDHLPLVTPIFCFLLSLQFIWIFVLLDINIHNNHLKTDDIDKTKSRKADETLSLNKRKMTNERPAVTFETFGKDGGLDTSSSSKIDDKEEEKLNGDKNDTADNTSKRDPSLGHKCVQTDDIYCYIRHDRPYGIRRLVIKLLYCKCCSNCQGCLCHNAITRLISLFWLFILLPFGLYRTIGRYFLLIETYEDYTTVIRPSEPFFLVFPQDSIWIFDFIYATFFPFVYIFCGYISYKSFFISDQQLCCTSEDKDFKLVVNNQMLSYRFTFGFFKFFRAIDESCISRGCKDWKDLMKNIIICFCAPFLCISCVFPIIPFSCVFKKCPDTLPKLRRCNINQNDCCLTKIVKTIVVLILKFVSFLLIYAFCLRPIISTITFLFRSFTYFVFVALLIRMHILRYTLIVVTTVTYFVKYLHEIVNMNTEILNYVFTCEEKKKEMSVNFVSEKLYVYIYGRLLFVQKKLYILFFKTVVVFMYIFITIETFITNQNSLTGAPFKDLLEFLLIIISPYAVSLFLKGNNNDFLTSDNKKDIEFLFGEFYTKKDSPDTGSETNSSSSANQKAWFSKLIEYFGCGKNMPNSSPDETTPLIKKDKDKRKDGPQCQPV